MPTSDNVPHRYNGYDGNGKNIAGKNADDANLQINPQEIGKAVEKAKQNIEEANKGIKEAIEDFETDAIKAIQIEGVTGFDGIDELKEAVGKVPSGLCDLFDKTVSEAQKVHDKIQEQYNIAAYKIVEGHEDVKEIKESEINL